MTINRWLILILFILIIGLMICCPCKKQTMEGLSQKSSDALNMYNIAQKDKQSRAKEYFNEVLFDSSANNNDKRAAAEIYRRETPVEVSTKIFWFLKKKTKNKEYLYADAAVKYFDNPTKANALRYKNEANTAGVSDANRFKATLADYLNGNETEKDNLKNINERIQNSNLNSTLKTIINDDCYDATTPIAQKNYERAKKQYEKTISSGSPEQKYVDAKAYYDATVKWYTTNQEKYYTAKKYYEATKNYGNALQKYDAAKAYYEATKNYGNAFQKYEAAEAYYNATKDYGNAQQKYDAANAYYEKTKNYGNAQQKFIAAKAYYNLRMPEQHYVAAKAYYDATIGSGSSATSEDKYESRKACYMYALPVNKYIAAKNLLEYIEKNPEYRNKIPNVPDTEIAKTLYYNSPENVKFESARGWYNMAKSTDAAEAYYKESKNSSCENKCLATKAYYENDGGSTDTNISYERNYYIGLMGENCEKQINQCDISSSVIPTPKEGFQNREQCQQNTQKPIFKSAENAFLSYNTTPNQKYSELDTMNIYFKYATKENGLNTNDIMNAAKKRVEYMKSMKIIDYEALRLAALDYYKASLALDCGDIVLNRYLAIKTYYEIAENNPNADKLDLSKKYYKHTVDLVNSVDNTDDAKYRDHAKVYHPIQYAVAKKWFANSQFTDCEAGNAMFDSVKLPFNGIEDPEKYSVIDKFKKSGCELTPIQNMEISPLLAVLSVRTDQTQQEQHAKHTDAKSMYTKMKEGFDFSEKPEGCSCSNSNGYDATCSEYCAYISSDTPQQKLIDAQDWSKINYQRDIVNKRKELDNELSKLDNNAAAQIQKMNLDTTIMMNIAATVLASSLIVFSITKL